VGELRKYWDEVNGKLLSQFASLSEDQWLHRHYAMSEEDYAKDPIRNRLAALLSRTNHISTIPLGADNSSCQITFLFRI
jgi:hypothetical protein